jgi:tetratricopeptide (TPR) repeat protein
MKDSEFYLVRAIIIIAALVIGFFGSRLIGALYFNKLMAADSSLGEFQKQYQEKINLETDPYELAKLGMIFLRIDDNETALLCFDKAAKLDANWRDGWVWKGYTEIKLNQPKPALESLKTAEKIDPIYPLTYQLLVIAYEQTGDTQSAQFAQEKLVYLSKSYQK